MVPARVRFLPFAPLLLSFLVLGPLGGPPVAAQGLGSAALIGIVTTPEGQPVPQAQVELRYVPTGAVARSVTNEAGRFLLVNVRSGGPYDLTVSALGYSETERTGIQLAAEERLELELTLSQQPIAVEGVGVLVDRRFDVSREGPALNVTREVISSHPTIERGLLELAALSPVVVQTSEEGGLSISGQNERQNAVLIDGSLNQDVFGSSSSGTPGAAARAKPIPLEAIQEFRVDVAPFDVRSAGFTGGVLNAVTRTGTNSWEGSAFSQLRNERLFGSLLLDGADVAPEEYQKHVWGFNVGGPLKRDEMHAFLAAEFESRREPAPGFSLGVHEPLSIRMAADSLSRAVQIFDGYGVDAGTPSQVFLDNPLSNVFARLDWRLGDEHTLTLRHNYAGAARDSTPNRAPFGPYELSSVGHRIESSNHAFTGKLVSRFGNGHSNELAVNIQRSSDRSTPNSTSPQVDVRVSSVFDDLALVRSLRAGSRYFSQHDQLDQTVVELTDAVTLARDRIVTTLGANVDIFRFDQDDRPGSLGYYRFDGLGDLEANRPSYYEVNVLDPSVPDPSVRFTVVQPSLFFQSEHRFPPELVLSYGVRLDVPIFPTDPEYNERVEEEFDTRTDQLPSGKLLLSPRLGFNWQSQRGWRTQVRGGFGIFTGRVPFVWMSDTYRHSGLRAAVLSCEGEKAPLYDPSSPAPTACADGSGVAETGQATVVAFDPDFKYPRELKVTAAVDQDLPADFYLSMEGLFVQTHGRTLVRDLNISAPASATDAGYGRAFGLRAHYGRPLPYGYAPTRRVEDLSQVLLIENDERTAIAYALTFELQKSFGSWLDMGGSVTLAGSDDKQSLVFTDMLTNYAAAPIGRQVTERPARPANFDRPRKYLANVRTRLPARWGGAELAVVYTGQSGQPYSYVYGSDINGDGYSGPGIPLDASNDLLFIPAEPTQVPATLATKSLLAQLASSVEPCLADVRDEIMERNSCRSPSTHRLDLRFVQPIDVGGVRLDLTGDVMNVLNLLNRDWGRVWEVDPLVPLLDVVTRLDQDEQGIPIPTSEALLGYQGGVTRDPQTGNLRPTLPYNLITPASQWQAQIGLRLSF